MVISITIHFSANRAHRKNSGFFPVEKTRGFQDHIVLTQRIEMTKRINALSSLDTFCFFASKKGLNSNKHYYLH